MKAKTITEKEERERSKNTSSTNVEEDDDSKDDDVEAAISENDANVDAKTISKNDTPAISENDARSISEKDTKIIPENDVIVVSENDAKLITENDAIVASENDVKLISENDAIVVSENDVNSISENDEANVDTKYGPNAEACSEPVGEVNVGDVVEEVRTESVDKEIVDAFANVSSEVSVSKACMNTQKGEDLAVDVINDVIDASNNDEVGVTKAGNVEDPKQVICEEGDKNVTQKDICEDTKNATNEYSENVISKPTEKIIEDTKNVISKDTENVTCEDTENVPRKATDNVTSGDFENVTSEDTKNVITEHTENVELTENVISEDTQKENTENIINEATENVTREETENIINEATENVTREDTENVNIDSAVVFNKQSDSDGNDCDNSPRNDEDDDVLDDDVIDDTNDFSDGISDAISVFTDVDLNLHLSESDSDDVETEYPERSDTNEEESVSLTCEKRPDNIQYLPEFLQNDDLLSGSSETFTKSDLQMSNLDRRQSGTISFHSGRETNPENVSSESHNHPDHLNYSETSQKFPEHAQTTSSEVPETQGQHDPSEPILIKTSGQYPERAESEQQYPERAAESEQEYPERAAESEPQYPEQAAESEQTVDWIDLGEMNLKCDMKNRLILNNEARGKYNFRQTLKIPFKYRSDDSDSDKSPFPMSPVATASPRNQNQIKLFLP